MGRGAGNKVSYRVSSDPRSHYQERLDELALVMKENEKNWEDSFPLTLLPGRLVQAENCECAITLSIETDEKEGWNLYTSLLKAQAGNIEEETLYKGKDLEEAFLAAKVGAGNIKTSSGEEPFPYFMEDVSLAISKAAEEETSISS